MNLNSEIEWLNAKGARPSGRFNVRHAVDLRTPESIRTLKRRERRAPMQGAFTLVELLVVIAIMGIVAAMVIGLSGAANSGERRKRVTAQRDQLVSAIESYKKQHGFYPPDNTNNCVFPPLYYELKGATVEQGPMKFVGSFPTITAADYLAIFSRSGIANSKPANADQDGEAKAIDFSVGIRSQQSTNITVVTGVESRFFTVGIESAPGADFRLNTWRYVSTNPTNNGVGHFDLWAEIVINGKTETIGNWSK
jgi:prepilin-type N-terminal cleavage/methylation domain-containing protein